LAGALSRIEAGDTELATGACVAADATALAGGHLIEAPTRRTIAAGTLAVSDRCAVRDPLALLVSGVAARLTDEPTAIPILHEAVTSAAEDQTRLQTVAGRHVHVVYFDTVLAAADVFDDRAWDDLTHVWAQLARRTGALAALPLALAFRSWLEVLQGRFGSAASHLAEIEDVVTLTGSRGLLGSPTPARVLRDAWQGNEDAARTGARRMMQDAHERGQGIGIDHAYTALTILEIGAGRYDAALRAARRVLDHNSAQRHPHEPRRLTGQPAGIAEAHRHDVFAARHEMSAIDDHDETMLPVRATAVISTGLQSAGRSRRAWRRHPSAWRGTRMTTSVLRSRRWSGIRPSRRPVTSDRRRAPTHATESG
jgi:hypothetical protein